MTDLELARECGARVEDLGDGLYSVTLGEASLPELMRRIRQEVIEECAKECDALERRKWETIRDGGTLAGFGAKDCAAAIRSRGLDESKEGSAA